MRSNSKNRQLHVYSEDCYNLPKSNRFVLQKSRCGWAPSQVLRRPTVKTHRTGQYKPLKTGDSDLDNLRAVNSSGKVILTACLAVCMCECVRECI